ncbi:trigger factor, partial [Spirochaetes bacterium]|nr:trigger factor [Candidatus Scatousia excrementipullorum]
MKVTLENEKENVVKVNITIPAEEATNAYNAAVKRIAQHINVDGFRKGKAPRQVIERQIGEERIKQEALEGMMPKVIAEVIQENNLDVITQPYITSYDFKKGEDLNVVVTVETRPEVKLGDYKNLTVEVNDVPVTEDAINETLERVRKNYAEEKIISDRASKDTDIVNIDFEGFVNGEAIKGGAAKNYNLNLANSNFIPGFAEQLTGKNAGDEFEINVKFPEDYHDDSLKGKDATFKIKLNVIKESVVPELNDELAQKAGSFKTVEELKEDVKKRLEESREHAKKINADNEVFKKVIDN